MTDQDAAIKLANPVQATKESVAKGKQLFTIYCTPCHGVSGTGNGLVGEKLILRPFDLTADRMQDLTDGYIFGYVTLGGAVMPSYANDLSPTERWHVINYVRNGLKPTTTAQTGSEKK
jgi:mono/diheme cytochrome c family protein